LCAINYTKACHESVLGSRGIAELIFNLGTKGGRGKLLALCPGRFTCGKETLLPAEQGDFVMHGNLNIKLIVAKKAKEI